jgi:hypothetical protein
MSEYVGVADILTVVVESYKLEKWRTGRVDIVKQAKLAQDPHTHGQQNQVGALINDDFWSALKQNEINVGPPKRLSCSETDGAAADNDDLEVAGAHFVVMGSVAFD